MPNPASLLMKTNLGDRSSAAKSKTAAKNHDEYLAGVSEPARSTLNKGARDDSVRCATGDHGDH